MRLTTKLVLGMIVGLALAVGIDNVLTIRQKVDFFDRDAHRHGALVGAALREGVIAAWEQGGESEALALVQRANAHDALTRVRWVWLDAKPGASDGPALDRALLTPALRGKTVSVEVEEPETGHRFFTVLPVSIPGERPGAIEISEDLTARDRYLRTLIWRAVGLTVTTLLLGGVLATLLGTWMVGLPLRRLKAKARAIGQGDFSTPLHLRGRDELADLGEAMNDMCVQLAEGRRRLAEETAARIAALEQLQHEDRLRTVGRLASGIAHELGTPLNVVSGTAELLATGELEPEEVRSSSETIRAQTRRMTTLIRHLLDYARRSPPQRKCVDLRDLAARSLELLESVARKRRASLVQSGEDEPVEATVDPSQIQQVVTNLLVNALHAVDEGGRVEVSVAHSDRTGPPGSGEERSFACIRVADDGAGIPPEQIPHVFEPFYTTKEAGEGTGLGLSICERIAREHGGWIEVESEPGEGARFTVYLPYGEES